MKQTLKIIGIALGVLVLLAIVQKLLVGNFDGEMLSNRSSDYSAPSGGLPGTSLPSFSNPMDSKSVSDIGRNSGRFEERAEVSQNAPAPEKMPSEPAKKIIKNGNLSLRVGSIDKAAGKITEVAKNNQGEVSSSNFSQYGSSSKSGSMTVKVPVANFEKAFSELKEVAIIVTNESTTGQDVTEQYADLQAQLRNKQTEEQAFVRIMDQAGKIEDILAVQRELSRVRGQIEQLQGKIKLLESQTDMSTIGISLSEDTNVTIVDSWRPWQVVKESANELIKSVQDWIDFLIRLVIKVIPVLLLYGIIIYIFYLIGRKIYVKFIKKDTLQ